MEANTGKNQKNTKKYLSGFVQSMKLIVSSTCSSIKRFFPVDTGCIDISLFIIYSSFG